MLSDNDSADYTTHMVDEAAEQPITIPEDKQMDNNLTDHEQARLLSLKAMLDASNTRYEMLTRNRQPRFAAGLEIKVINGDHEGKFGVVLDADYIANRALVSLSDQESPHWINFQFLGHAD